ncbi:hypothetical protein [Nocardiopsis rhodophaea]|uniref:hypothetical protein n=1 Tax=Nocardiopsis rhodophaea TaxID=280238 RepID=UPI0031D7829F
MNEAGLNRGRVLLAVALAQLTVTMVMPIVTAALLAMCTGRGSDLDRLSWFVSAYSLVSGGLLLGGWAAGVDGQRRLRVGGAIGLPGRAREAVQVRAADGVGAPVTEVRR